MLDWNNIRFFLSMTHCIAQIVFSQMNYISLDNFIRFLIDSKGISLLSMKK